VVANSLRLYRFTGHREAEVVLSGARGN